MEIIFLNAFPEFNIAHHKLDTHVLYAVKVMITIPKLKLVVKLQVKPKEVFYDALF